MSAGRSSASSILTRKEVIPQRSVLRDALAARIGPELVQDLADRLDGAREHAEAKAGGKVLDKAQDRLEARAARQDGCVPRSSPPGAGAERR